MKKLIILITTLLSLNSLGAELNGVTHPDSVELGGKKLVLNGIATRKATWIKVKVYVGGFYMEKKSSDYNTFLKEKSPKKIIMTFVRDVDGKDLIDGWKEAFGNALPKDKHPALQERMDKFYSYFGDIEKKQSMEFNFLEDGVESTINGVKKEKIKGFDFSSALLSVWFVNAKDEGLKEGLLGL
jgi:hypothetical protein